MSSCQQEVLLACRYSPVARHVSRVKHVCVFAHNTMCVHLILYYILHVIMFVALSVSVCVCVYLHVGWGLGLLWTENIPPSHNLRDPAVSLPTAIYFFTPHTAASTPITQTHTHTHAPTAPVAPPRLLGEEHGDPGPMRRRGGGGQTGENLPWFSLLKLFSSG